LEELVDSFKVDLTTSSLPLVLSLSTL
jgi:hypothetical protein